MPTAIDVFEKVRGHERAEQLRAAREADLLPYFRRLESHAGPVVEMEGPEGGGGEASVQVTRDGLADDSVRAVRYEVLLEKAGDGTWRLRSAKRLQRCHLNRGHQDFSPQLCR